jgi:hypothetical protein
MELGLSLKKNTVDSVWGWCGEGNMDLKGRTRDCRELHNEELHNLYCSLNTVRMVKSRM